MDLWKILLLVLLAVLVVLYLVLIPLARRGAMRKQAAKFDEVHAKLKAGDQVVLADGIVGKIKELTSDDVQLTIAAGVTITVKRMGIIAVEKEAANNGHMAPVHSTSGTTTPSKS
ncbi:preprotein translocase subunit YajC [Schleiferilactobacillus perolens]|uniref:Preprotein translocase subunit YajC n=1 Tax=Schleiferilactobacillus perolens DSM 12744 TaxID=1423792 RepID=A0A0R1N3X9_9LACO|nr:preprotein translocase subunit YajC [Schleiferilactobacillus perolens]KRL12469.1 hypothetical protein FD09_GL003055 [Schleiferilactobacillus perolens DSM 12744]